MPKLLDLFFEMAASHADKMAIHTDHGTITYGELAAEVVTVSRVMTEAGLSECQTIALQGMNVTGFVVAYLAAANARLCVVPIDSRLSTEEVEVIARDSRPAAYVLFSPKGSLPAFVEHRFGGGVSSVLVGRNAQFKLVVPPPMGAPPAVFPGDLVIQYSSGSTGEPKGIVLSRDNIYHKVTNWDTTLEISDLDVFLCTLTLSHCYGMYVHMLAALLTGATVYLPDLHTVTPRRIAQMIDAYDVTVFGSLPYMYQLLLRLPIGSLKLDRVRYLISGSAPLPDLTAHRFCEVFGRNINQVYGLTEIGLICFNKNPHAPTSIGSLTHRMEARILDDLGRECAHGEPGELAVRCDSLARGYLNNPEDQQMMFKDGWLYTKDIVSRDNCGQYYICGRVSQFINVGGNKVSPIEIENVLLEHPAVMDASVVGRRGDGTEEVVAFVVLRDDHPQPNSDDLFRFCTQRMSAYKLPKDIKFLPELPRSPLGKVLKAKLCAL
jgi:acyl-CoA synthetase (AMP-forming)/AMP-acid ligase II